MRAQKKEFQLKDSGICYAVQKHARSKSIRLHIYPDGRVLVTIPRYGSFRSARAFAESKARWIAEKRKAYQKHETRSPEERRKHYALYKESARVLIHARLPELNRVYGFRYGRVSVRDQRSRWGSCSAKGNLNFSYKILFLPPKLQDYILVHELCHLQELNHSQDFWDLVSKRVPDYKEVRRKLRGIRL